MGNVEIVLRQIVIMFLYMGIGALLFKKGLITREGSKRWPTCCCKSGSAEAGSFG